MRLINRSGDEIQIGDTIWDRLDDKHTFLMVLPDKRIVTRYHETTCRYKNESFPSYLVVDDG